MRKYTSDACKMKIRSKFGQEKITVQRDTLPFDFRQSIHFSHQNIEKIFPAKLTCATLSREQENSIPKNKMEKSEQGNCILERSHSERQFRNVCKRSRRTIRCNPHNRFPADRFGCRVVGKDSIKISLLFRLRSGIAASCRLWLATRSRRRRLPARRSAFVVALSSQQLAASNQSANSKDKSPFACKASCLLLNRAHQIKPRVT